MHQSPPRARCSDSCVSPAHVAAPVTRRAPARDHVTRLGPAAADAAPDDDSCASACARTRTYKGHARTHKMLGPLGWLERLALVCWLLVGLVGCGGALGSSAYFPITSQQNETTGDEWDAAGNGTNAMRCNDARMKCAYRAGCGRALQHYLTRCASVLQGDVNDCPEICQHALIGLMSTDEGKDLMTCACAKDDLLCYRSKQRAEICRASVTATMNRTRVSCRVATWICNADALCSTALFYYNENCKRMFRGKKCTKRCRNSISILRRQEKAAKLNTCFCDGAEDYDCTAIHRNMDELCFKQPAQQHNYQEPQPGPGSGGGGGSDGAAAAAPRDPKLNKPALGSQAPLVSASPAWTILLLSLALLLRPPTR